MSNHIHRVVIAGGGLGGLTAAYLLRSVGMKVTVLEQANELGEVGAGIQTAPNASRILINAGLRPQLEAIKTQPTSQVRRRWSDGKILASRPLGDTLWQEFGAPYWHFHRADLHQMLVDVCSDPTLPGPVVDLHTNSKVATADQSNPALPVAITEDGRRYEGDVLIGADGVHSRVRAAMGMSEEEDLLFSGQMVFRAMVPGEKLKADPATRFLWDSFHSTMWYGPGRHLVHYFIRGGEYLNVAAALSSDVNLDKGWTEETTAEEFIRHSAIGTRGSLRSWRRPRGRSSSGPSSHTGAIRSGSRGMSGSSAMPHMRWCRSRLRVPRRRSRMRPCSQRNSPSSTRTRSPLRCCATAQSAPSVQGWCRRPRRRTPTSTSCPTDRAGAPG